MSAIITLVNGPSKFDLMTALFIRKPEKPTLQFKPEHSTNDDYTFTAVITGVSEEDGSGESWNISGYLRDIFVVGGPEHGGVARKVHSQPFKGYFSTSSRKGWLTFID
ncbi:MAG TPA: hypothetical protein VJJ20_00960 [Candidatus Paceibacterota bacterium]